MNLKKMKEVIDKACDRAGECDGRVEVWLGNKCFEIREINQFSVVPTLCIMLGEKVCDLTE